MSNPYIPGNVVSPPHFYGRTALASQLLRDDQSCTYLMGPRRIGKTSMLRYVRDHSHVMSLFINLQSCATGKQGTLDSRRVAGLIKRLLDDKAADDSAAAQIYSQVQQVDTLCDTLQELAWGANKRHVSVLILWDEAEKMLDLEREELEPLRSIMQDSPAIRTVLAATKGLGELNDRCRQWKTSPFLFGFVTQTIAALDDEEAAALIRQRDNPQGQISVDDTLVAQIAHLCGNHPFLIQVLCQRLFRPNRSLHPPTEADLVVDESLAHIFANDFEQLPERDQRVLRAVGKHPPRSEAALKRETQIGGETLRALIRGLEQLSLVRRARDGYEPGNAFLARWLKMTPPKINPAHVSDRAGYEVADADQQHFQHLRETARRRLRVREQQAAQSGMIDVDPQIIMEIEDLRAEIRRLDSLIEDDFETKTAKQ